MGVVGPKRLFVNRDGALEERAGGGEIALIAKQSGEIIDGPSGMWMVWA